jgi:hypothetical protein
MTLALAMVTQGAPDEASEGGEGPIMPLYMVGDSALAPGRPTGDSDSEASFRPGVGMNPVEVGVWQSRPVEEELEMDGRIKVSIWAAGSGVQSSCFFGITIGVDGQSVVDTIQTQETALGGGPQEYIGEGTAKFNLTKGQSITATIKVHERGSGGAVLFGSATHSSFISFSAEPVKTATYAEEHKAGESILVRTMVKDTWGVEDIEKVEQYILGPFDSRQLDIDLDSIPDDKVVARATHTSTWVFVMVSVMVMRQSLLPFW